MTKWEDMLTKSEAPTKKAKIAVVGKYIELQDAYKSIYESLQHAAIHEGVKLEIVRVSSEDEKVVKEIHRKVDGVLVPGGFGSRGVEGKILAVRNCRKSKLPFFGICMGMQVAAIEYARNVCGLKEANSLELDSETPHPLSP